MLLNIGFEPNYERVWAQKQRHINYDNVRENAKPVQHTYSVGDYAYVLRDGVYHKLEGDKLGLYHVTEVFTNNTVRIQEGVVNECINIHRLTPHFGQPPNLAPYLRLSFFLFFFFFFSFFQRPLLPLYPPPPNETMCATRSAHNSKYNHTHPGPSSHPPYPPTFNL